MLNVTVTMMEPWHVGTGLGQARTAPSDTSSATDARQFRSGGRAAIPGSHFKGIVKDASRKVLTVLDSDQPAFAEAFDQVFGLPGRDDIEGWDFSDPLVVVAALVDDVDPVSPKVSTHNRIDRRNKRVPKGAMHDREVVAATVLQGAIHPRPGATDLERALVAASVLACEAIGAKRSRGHGLCQTSVVWSDSEGDTEASALLAPLFSEAV